MSNHAPDLIARAAERLRKAERAPKPAERAPDPVRLPDPALLASAAVQDPHAAAATVHGAMPSVSAKSSRLIAVDYGTMASHGVVLPSEGRNRTIEEFRIIKRQVVGNAMEDMAQGTEGPSGRLIMVTSSRPTEGKTFTAANLALSIASERDLTVLLVDADAHHPSVPEVFGFRSELGLLDLLANSAIDFSDVVLRTPVPNLAILPIGTVRATEVPELLSSRRMGNLIREMEARYPDRFIIFDVPPCLASSEPSVLAGLMGQVVFVIEADRTQLDEMRLALNLVQRCRKIGFVLNKINPSKRKQFGSYSYYYQQHNGQSAKSATAGHANE